MKQKRIFVNIYKSVEIYNYTLSPRYDLTGNAGLHIHSWEVFYEKKSN